MTSARAIIDIGSNTVRLVVYGGPARAPTTLLNEKVNAKLGKAFSETGQLSEKAMAAALAALARYALLLRLKGVRGAVVVATAAVRDAGNGPQFLEAVRALGLKVRLLSGEEEAAASAHGVLAAFPGARGTVADLGGGSLELIKIDGQRSGDGTSLPLGTLRLPQLRSGGPGPFAGRIVQALEGSDAAWAWGAPLYLVGGSHRAFARYAMHQLDWPLDDPHGFELAPDRAARLCAALADGKAPVQVPGLSQSRAASLPDAAALLGQLVRVIAPPRLVFSSWGLREGLLHQKLGAAARAQDPLLAAVAAFAEGRGCSAAIAAIVAGWTAPIVRGAGGARETLRLVATMLALASQSIEPNLRAELSAEWALRKRWVGLDPPGRAMIAAALLANTGRTELPAPLARLASDELLGEALTWGASIRLCRRFSSLSGETLGGSSLAVEGGRLVLAARPPYDSLYTDMIEKDLRLLAETMKLAYQFRREDADAKPARRPLPEPSLAGE